MARRNNRKLARARHDALLADEREHLDKRKTRAARRARAVSRRKNSGFTVGEASSSAPKLGTPVTGEVVKDVKMKPVGSISKRGKGGNKKAKRRMKKILQRQSDRNAMVM